MRTAHPGSSSPLPSCLALPIPLGDAARDWRVIRHLLPYLWAYKGRVIAALLALIGAKVANVGVPVLLKQIVDSLDQRTAMLAVPLALLVAYGALRAVDHGLHRAARIPVRQGDAALGAHHRARGLPPSARAVAALSPRAPDRRAHPRRRARHARHLDADQFHAVLDPADAGRDRPCVGDPDRALRLDVHRDHRLRARALHRCPPC